MVDNKGYDASSQIEQLEAINKLLTDYGKAQTQLVHQLKNTVIIVTIAFMVILCSMVFGFFWYESQYDTTTSTITTTTLTTEGENANINSVTNGDMYNDDSTHTE